MTDIRESFVLVREALLSDPGIYNGFVSSIISALNDLADTNTDNNAKAEFIANRLIGVEK